MGESKTMEKQFIISAVCLLALSLSSCSSSTPQPTVKPTIVVVGHARDFANGSVTAIDLPATFDDPDPPPIGSATPGVVTQLPVAPVSPVPIFLVRDTARGFLALYARDPFRGCRIKWVEADQQFKDPCYGSRYSQTGDWLTGSSPRNLDRFDVSVNANGEIVVDIDKYQSGEQHP